MNPTLINTIEDYKLLVEQYSRRGCLKNDYIQAKAADLINQGRLSAICGQENAMFLVERDGFYRGYYYINNIKEPLPLPKYELVTEILFRGENAPEEEIQWLANLGFRKYLVRDQYYAKHTSIASSNYSISATIELAQTIDEVKWAIDLFNGSFDKWSGDYISPLVCASLFDKKEILIAKDENGQLSGALHHEKRQGVCWLNHIAVISEARGKGIGKGLLDAFIEYGYVDDNSRYMLWVQRQNTIAVTMYRDKGFSPMNKSALSLVRL